MDLAHLTIYQQVALVRDQVGESPRLLPYDEILKVLISPTRCGITVRRWNVLERATETRLTNPRQVTRAWNCDAAGVWSPVIMEIDGRKTVEFSLEDDTVKQHKIISHRAGKSVDEWRDQLYWHALAGRPGAGRLNQRDYDAVQAEIATLWSKTIGLADYNENAPNPL